MAINLDERYPGRANGKTLSYPQGSFKNRTSPTAKDGTYLEQDWANDQLAFFQSLMKDAGMTASGTVDTVEASQYFDALQQIIDAATPDATETVRGMVEFATQAQTDAGTLDNAAVTPKKLRAGFAANFGSNGYLAFPSWLGGLIVQWGQIAQSTLPVGYSAVLATFPLVFPNNSFGVVSVPTAGGGFSNILGYVSDSTLSGFRENFTNNAGGPLSIGAFWLSFGR